MEARKCDGFVEVEFKSATIQWACRLDSFFIHLLRSEARSVKRCRVCSVDYCELLHPTEDAAQLRCGVR